MPFNDRGPKGPFSVKPSLSASVRHYGRSNRTNVRGIRNQDRAGNESRKETANWPTLFRLLLLFCLWHTLSAGVRFSLFREREVESIRAWGMRLTARIVISLGGPRTDAAARSSSIFDRSRHRRRRRAMDWLLPSLKLIKQSVAIALGYRNSSRYVSFGYACRRIYGISCGRTLCSDLRPIESQ